MRGHLTLAAAALTLVAIGCGAVNARPYLTPLPEAPVDTVDTEAQDLIGELAALVTAEGLGIRLVSPSEGYLETEWYNVDSRQTVSPSAGDIQRVVLLRFFADPLGRGETRLVSEAVVVRALDPSLPRRENEMMVPPGHPGDTLLQRIRSAVSGRVAGRLP
jgi:hypothetical protein